MKIIWPIDEKFGKLTKYAFSMLFLHFISTRDNFMVLQLFPTKKLKLFGWKFTNLASQYNVNNVGGGGRGVKEYADKKIHEIAS